MLKTVFKKWSQTKLPQVNGRIYLPTLQNPVTVYRDRWGIPHIYAQNRHDLFFAQGFVQAQDRMWQMELNRRAALGTLSALFGPLTLETDRLARTLGFHRLAHNSWEQLDEDARADVAAYSAGINAWLGSKPALPLEFSLVRHTPEPWQPLHTLAYGRLQMWALACGASSEWIKGQLIQTIGEEKASFLGLNYPADNPVTLPQGIEVVGLKLGGLMGTWTHPFAGKGTLDGAGRGSNGWVIGPERSRSGRTILCNDMHLPVGTPSLWYTMHLHSADGIHVTGFTQPGLPFVMVGHNEHIAWGATLSFIDCEDLFLEQFHPEKKDLYNFRESWRQATIIEEEIVVRGRQSVTEQVVLTHHGPIVSGILVDTERPAALASKALLPEIPMDGFRLLNEAADWDDFVTAVARIQAPSLNLLYADRQDNIGYYVSGRAPVRAGGDGTLPVPGWSGDYEWIDEIPFAEMPHALNPVQGFIVSANQKITGEGYPHFLGSVWRNGYRAHRLVEMITAQEKISTADCGRFQMDLLTIPGRQLIELMEQNVPDSSKLPAAAQIVWQLLREWDGRLTPESCGGTVYEVLIRQLSEALLAPHLPELVRYQALGLGENALLQPVNELIGEWLVSLLNILKDDSNRWLPDKTGLLIDSLVQTTAVLQQKLGPNPAGWQWGRLHHITFAHAFDPVPGLGHIFSQGPFPTGGDGDTVAQTSIRPDLPYDNNAISVSSRLIVDMGQIEQAEALHSPGQSGHLASPHYGDLIQPWLEGDYYRLLWQLEEVRAVAEACLTLEPV